MNYNTLIKCIVDLEVNYIINEEIVTKNLLLVYM